MPGSRQPEVAAVVTRFHDRRDAGRRLAALLGEFADRSDVLVLGLPRGGAVVAAEVADALHVPFDVWLVRKLGVPGYGELAMGAVASGGVEIHNADIIDALHIPPSVVRDVAVREGAELLRRERTFRDTGSAPAVRGRTVILVDDGLATGATMEAAVMAMRKLEAATIVVAVPVGAADTCGRLRKLAGRVICAETPDLFRAVGEWYDDFGQTSDDEVVRLLRERPLHASGGALQPK